jgi:hypothetical protein
MNEVSCHQAKLRAGIPAPLNLALLRLVLMDFDRQARRKLFNGFAVKFPLKVSVARLFLELLD